MYCPNCGKADQAERSYCRQCGEYLSKSGTGAKFGGETPEQQMFISQFLNVMTGLTGFGIGIALLYQLWGSESIPLVYYLAMAFSFVIAFWQISVFFVNWNLSSHFKKRRDYDTKAAAAGQVESAETKELLPEADMTDVVPGSVTETTTKDLKEKVRRST